MLHKLLEYADLHGIRGEAGFSNKRIRFLFRFSPQGEYLGLHDYGPSGEEFDSVPHLQTSGDKPIRHFLVDTIEFLAFYPPPADNSFDHALDELKAATEELLNHLRQEPDYEEIESLSRQIISLFEQKEYLELREGNYKKKWGNLLKRRNRGKREDVQTFLRRQGIVDRIFQNPEFKRLGKNQFCMRLLQEASEAIPLLGIISKVMRKQQVLEKIHADLAEHKAKETNNATFAVLDNDELKIFVRTESWHDWWKNKHAELTDSLGKYKARCFLSGENAQPLLTHPKIKGLARVGGTAETSLISFDKGKGAFQSYGFLQGENAPVSVDASVKYTAAINHLLNYCHQELAGSEVIYWYSKEIEPIEDIIQAAFTGFGKFVEDEDETENNKQQEDQAILDARKFLQSVASGKVHHLRDVQYCALTLQGNKGRAVVQNWMEGSFVELAKNFDQWFSDLEIPRLSGRGAARPPKIETLITCLLKERKPQQKKQDWIKPVSGFRDAIWRAAIGGRVVPFPENTVRLALERLRESMLTDEWANAIDANGEKMGMRRSRLYARIGLIKAYLIRNIKQEINMEEKEKNKNSVYWLGCLFAVLAELQRAAHQSDGGKNVRATVVDRFYTTASTCPKLVYGRLLAQSQHHLRKLENLNKTAAKAINRNIAEISRNIDLKEVPDMLPLAEQSWFALGYYQQIADMNQRKAEAYAKKKTESKKGEKNDCAN